MVLVPPYDRRRLKYFCLIMDYSYPVPGGIILLFPTRHKSKTFKNNFSSKNVWPVSLRLIPRIERKARGRQCNSQRKETDDSCWDILGVKRQHASLKAYLKESQDMVPKVKCSKALPKHIALRWWELWTSFRREGAVPILVVTIPL